MIEKVTMPVSQVMILSNAIAALGQPDLGSAIKFNLTGTLAMSWNLSELNRLATPIRADAGKRRDAIMADGGDPKERQEQFDREIAELMNRTVEVSLIRIKRDDILESNGGGALVTVLSQLVGTVIDYSCNGS